MFNLTPTVRNLLIANVLFLVAQQSLLPLLTQIGSLYPIGTPLYYPWQFFTYMFLHSGWGHLFSNMLALLVFGPRLEQLWGATRFLTFWLVCGVGAGLCYDGVRAVEIYRMEQSQREFRQAPSGPDYVGFFEKHLPEASGYQDLAVALDREPQNQAYIAQANREIGEAVAYVRDSRAAGMLGASGAVFGILFAFAYLFPNLEMYLLFIPFPIKAKYLVFVDIMYELYRGTHRVPGDDIAHFAHLGGALVAFIALKIWEGGSGRERFR
ncbi:rhomboid family intramembrane serine protease [Hymenobacter properus]|uniref:Rhomboid family intramembrane serine protease n=1 Tax=Hymenobacter properus TaxID=2791026 RepID=A0A931BL40_9BACT|nr:rhomboid family intramembrane serine protease [Hymenobacter properus]MBF9143396.1 rhomboid family intramembrane serine protease [Hymenobacter properus]MBR7722209.1 rhomboid family intramembrane serine protease [Microvirga sp. SRT04]